MHTSQVSSFKFYFKFQVLHLLNALLVLAIVTVKNRFYLFHSRLHASNNTVIEDEEEDDVFSRRPFILWSRR